VPAVRGRDPETALAAGPDAIPLHQTLHPQLAYMDAPSPQLPPDTRPAVGSAVLLKNCKDMNQQGLVTHVSALQNIPTADKVFMVTGNAHA
jgi:hypothetical protein